MLDVTGDSEKTGKNIGDDFRERKLTLPFIKAIAKATEEERRFWIRTIEKGEQIDGDLEQALSLLQSHGAIEATRKDAMEWAQKAQDSLSNLPEHPLRKLLSNLSVYVVERLT